MTSGPIGSNVKQPLLSVTLNWQVAIFYESGEVASLTIHLDCNIRGCKSGPMSESLRGCSRWIWWIYGSNNVSARDWSSRNMTGGAVCRGWTTATLRYRQLRHRGCQRFRRRRPRIFSLLGTRRNVARFRLLK